MDNLKELIKTYDEYTKLLEEEIHNMQDIAQLHGWKSTRYEKGKELREKIESLKDK